MPSLRLSNLANRHPRSVRTIVVALRLVIGVVFVASGFAKAVDPWGSVYKIGEYLAVWGWEYSHAMLVSAAVGLSALEFLCGLMLLLGCYRRSVVLILLAMMAFMLPLTFYLLIANPVADCGCFGDWLHISDGASFAKNVAITIGLLILLPYNRLQRAFISPYLQWVPLVVSAVYILGISYAGYYDQPVVDFRSYPRGSSLLTENSDSAADNGGNEAFDFIYEKDGESRAFDLDNLPDSTWAFVERRLRDGAQVSHATDTFVIRDTDGEDVTRDVISPEDYQLIVLVPSMRDVDISYTYYINQLYRQLPSDSVGMIGVIGGNERDLAFWKDLSMAEYPLYTADELQIKELARGEIAAVMLHDGNIIWKRTVSSLVNDLIIDKDDDDDKNVMDAAGIRLAGCSDCNETLYEPDDDEFLHDWTRLYAIVMVVIILVNNGALALFMMWRARVGKKLKIIAHHEKKS